MSNRKSLTEVFTTVRNAKSVNLLLLDCSESMVQSRKWDGLRRALINVRAKNMTPDALFHATYFNDSRRIPRDEFVPGYLLDTTPTFAPSGMTSLHVAVNRGLETLIGLSKMFDQYVGRHAAPVLTLNIFTDGEDTSSPAGQDFIAAATLAALAEEYFPSESDWERSKLMLTYFAFGNGSQSDMARQIAVYDAYHLPKVTASGETSRPWFKYSAGNGDAIEKAGALLGESLSRATEYGNTFVG